MLAHHRWRTGLLAAAAALLAGPGLACSSARSPQPGPGSGGTARPSASSTGTGEQPTGLPYLAEIGGLGRPCAVLGAAGSVWVADFASARVDRLDPATGKVTGTPRRAPSPAGWPPGAGPCGWRTTAATA